MSPAEPRGKRSWPLGLAAIAVSIAIAGAWWGLPLRSPQPLHSAPGPSAITPGAGGVVLEPGKEPRIDPQSLVPGKPLEVHVSLPPEAAGVGIESIWIYGESHAPTQIDGRKAGPTQVRLELGAELLGPGRHIIELRTDEVSPIPLRRYAFEVR